MHDPGLQISGGTAAHRAAWRVGMANATGKMIGRELAWTVLSGRESDFIAELWFLGAFSWELCRIRACQISIANDAGNIDGCYPASHEEIKLY
jgi:hypothetical protein